MNRLIDYFMPEWAKTANSEAVLGIRFVLIMGLVLSITMIPPFGLTFFFLFHAPLLSIVFACAAAICFLLCFFIRAELPLGVSRQILMATVVLLVLVSLYTTGGLNSPFVISLSALVAIAFVTSGRSNGWVWMGIIALGSMTAAVLTLGGVVLPMWYDVTTQPLMQTQFCVVLPIVNAVFLTIMENRMQAVRGVALAEKDIAHTAQKQVEEAMTELAAEKSSIEHRIVEATRASDTQRRLLEANAEDILDALRNIAGGNLTVIVQSDNNYHPLMRQVADEINITVANIRNLVRQVQASVIESSEIAAQVSVASNQMSATAEEQAAQTAQISTSVDEMSRALSESAQRTAIVASFSKGNGKVAQNGTEIMKGTITKMQDIVGVVEESVVVVQRLGDSSAEIGEIVQVIDEIADQTNLLALNAAIEAARAGDQGRGFAVVADEVRKLAERTAQATKQISGTIRQIQKETEEAVKGIRRGNSELTDGLSLAEQAGAALTKIVTGVQEVDDSLKEVAETGREQATTGSLVAQSVEQMVSAVEETAASITEIARSAERLENVMSNLHRLSDYFRTENDQNRTTVQTATISRSSSSTTSSTAVTSNSVHLLTTSAASSPTAKKANLDGFSESYRYGEFHFDKQHRRTLFKWLPTTKQMTNKEFQEMIMRLAVFCEKHRPVTMFVDAVQNQHIVPAHILSWHDSEIVPRYVAAGMLKIAFLMPEQVLVNTSTQEIFAEDKAANQLQVRFFADENLLLQWLNT